MIDRREFLQIIARIAAASAMDLDSVSSSHGQDSQHPASYKPARIPNEYSLFLPGEKEALQTAPSVRNIQDGALEATLAMRSQTLRPGEILDGWQLLTVANMNGVSTAIFEKHATHRGAIAYVTEQRGTIALIPKQIGDLSKVRPRPIDTSRGVKFERAPHYVPGPDLPGLHLLNSSEDPCYENVAALGPEYIGWTLVANEQGGPMASLYLQPDGTSREIAGKPGGDGSWAQDQLGPFFEPASLLPAENPQLYEYAEGYSKRTLLGGYLPVADTGVWNPV